MTAPSRAGRTRAGRRWPRPPRPGTGHAAPSLPGGPARPRQTGPPRSARAAARPAARGRPRSPAAVRRARLPGGPDDDRSAVGHDLRQLLADLGRVEAHGDDRVRAEQPRVLDHPVDGVTAAVLEQPGVLRDLALAQRGETGAE